MSSVEQIESGILILPPLEFRRSTDWIDELEQNRWDEQLERDVAAGRLKNLAAEALAERERSDASDHTEALRVLDWNAR